MFHNLTSSLLGTFMIVAVFLLFSAILFVLWNKTLVPAITVVRPITFVQAMGIHLFILMFFTHMNYTGPLLNAQMRARGR